MLEYPKNKERLLYQYNSLNLKPLIKVITLIVSYCLGISTTLWSFFMYLSIKTAAMEATRQRQVNPKPIILGATKESNEA